MSTASRSLPGPVECALCHRGPYLHERGLRRHLEVSHPEIAGARAQSLLCELAFRYGIPPANGHSNGGQMRAGESPERPTNRPVSVLRPSK